MHHLLAAEVPQMRRDLIAVVHAKWRFADADAVRLAFFGVERLAQQPFHQRGFARRSLAQENDFNFIEAASVCAQFFKIIAHGLRRVAGDFDRRADEGAVSDVNKLTFGIISSPNDGDIFLNPMQNG